ncbi:MAG TPA: alpha/beta hydrolase-fold protein [Pirellulaceae bacterium]|jgi:enterochelin esterase family protein|nr:alpha/beta hydrolase-fold protein [Pirellulaceae bacterium]
MGMTLTRCLSVAACLMALAASSSTARAQVVSPEVREDGAVIFRVQLGENAKQASVNIGGKDRPLTKTDGNVWEATAENLAPGIHEYAFQVEGTRMIDPSNRWVKKWRTLASLVEIPANPPSLTERQDVPHGVVVHARYPSKSVGGDRPVALYLPPGYDPTEERTYPLLLALHGFGDDETAWTEVGRAHLIADNLIAAGKIEPTIIAMPFGHPVPIGDDSRRGEYWQRNDSLVREDVMNDLLPFLETHVRVSQNPADRAVAGLSMGGGHALSIGLSNPEQFSAVAAFSAAAPQLETDELLAAFPSLRGPDASANRLKLLWIPIGESDFLLDRNRKFVAQLKEQGVTHVYRESPGGHEWGLWRAFLPEFLEQAFPKE